MKLMQCGKFQSTRPRGARLKIFSDCLMLQPFQSTRPRGARLSVLGSCAMRNGFQSTRPRGARPTQKIPVPARSTISFNPRARGGRDVFSILVVFKLVMFQSTRPRGARLHQKRSKTERKNVSIHAPAGGATNERCNSKRTSGVSIHAPAGGATSAVHQAIGKTSCFNPRARGGRDLYAPPMASPAFERFQSTRPRGARPKYPGWVN